MSRKLLLVEDEPGLVMTLTDRLAAEGFDVESATDAHSGLARAMSGQFDVILLDTPPVLAVADTRVICPHADAVVMLSRWRKTPRHAVRSALRALDLENIFLAGVVLTQVDVREQARAGEGIAQYYPAYRKYYAD